MMLNSSLETSKMAKLTNNTSQVVAKLTNDSNQVVAVCASSGERVVTTQWQQITVLKDEVIWWKCPTCHGWHLKLT